MSGRKNKGNQGYTLIELMFVMVLLILFGIMAFTLVVSGTKAYNNITAKKNTNSELRIAESYLNMKIRQNDRLNGIRIEKNPLTSGDAIVISEVIDGKTYETWIYDSQNKLREALILKGEAVTEDISFDIAEIDGFTAVYTKETGSLSIDVWKMYKGEKKSNNTIISIKSL